MSKSDPESAIFMEDTVQEVDTCPCLESVSYLCTHFWLAQCFPSLSEFYFYCVQH